MGRTITTVTGIRVGTPESQVERVYGKPSRRAHATGGRVSYYTCIGFDLSDANLLGSWRIASRDVIFDVAWERGGLVRAGD